VKSFSKAERASTRTLGDIQSEDFSRPSKSNLASGFFTSFLAAAQSTTPIEPCVSRFNDSAATSGGRKISPMETDEALRLRANAKSGRCPRRAVSFCGFAVQSPGDVLLLLLLHQFKPAAGNEFTQGGAHHFRRVFKLAGFNGVGDVMRHLIGQFHLQRFHGNNLTAPPTESNFSFCRRLKIKSA